MKRRTIAKELCDEGAVLVNGRRSTAGRELSPGDEVTLNLRNRQLSVAVVELPAEKAIAVSRAQDLYKVIRDERQKDEDYDPSGTD